MKYLEELFPSRKRHDFLDALYDCPVDFMSFFIKCMDDFFSSDMFGKLFFELADLLKPGEELADKYGAYACMLADMAMRVPQVKAYRLAALLGVVFESRVVQKSGLFSMVGYQYSATLANMTSIKNYDGSAYIDFRGQKDWSLNNAYEAVKKLRGLYRRFGQYTKRYFGISLWRKTFLFIKCRLEGINLHINCIHKYICSLFPQAMSQSSKSLDSLPQGLDLDSILAFSKQCWTAVIIRCQLLYYSISLF